MINWANRILTNVKTQLGDKCTNVVKTTNNMRASWPAVCVKVINNAATADDLEFEENAVTCTIQIEAFSKVSLTDAEKLMDTANEAMYRMGFKRFQGPQEVDNVNAPEIFRVISRYRRIIGANDTIDKFVTD